jgi:hypothetical protein
VVVPITSFLCSAKGLKFLLFGGGTGALLQLQWGALGGGGAGTPALGQEKPESSAGGAA